MEITAAQVKSFRDKTGLSMMDCKNALVEALGDEEKAIEILRKKGLAAAGKRAANVTAKGRIEVFVDPSGQKAGMVDFRCESEPVSNTEDFVNLTKSLAQQAAAQASPTVDALSEANKGRIEEVFNRLRENMKLANVASVHGHVGFYVHFNHQSGVLIEFTGPVPEELRKGIGMHAVSMRPPYNSREEVDPALVAKERELAKDQIKDKPANMIDKIVDGKINRWYGEICLLEQPYVKDDKVTVQQAIDREAKGVTIKRFIRFEVGA